MRTLPIFEKRADPSPHMSTMAEVLDPRDKSVQELEKEITCAVCHGHYQEAKLLSCMHYILL